MKRFFLCSLLLVGFTRNAFFKTAEIGLVFSSTLLETSQAYKDILGKLQAAEKEVINATESLQQAANKETQQARATLLEKGVTNDKDPEALAMQHQIEMKLRSLQDAQTAAKIRSLELSSQLTTMFAELRKEAANTVCKEKGLAMLLEDSLVLGLGEPKNYVNATKWVQEEMDRLFEQQSLKVKSRGKGMFVAENESKVTDGVSSLKKDKVGNSVVTA